MTYRIVLPLCSFLFLSLTLFGNNDDKNEETNIKYEKVLTRKNHGRNASTNSSAYTRFLYEPVATKRDKMIRDNEKRYSTNTLPEYRIKVKTIPSSSYRDRNYKLKRR
jgi:hypothetical protein